MQPQQQQQPQKRANNRKSLSTADGEKNPQVMEIEVHSGKIRDVMKWSLEDLARILMYYKERIDVEEAYQKGLDKVTKQVDPQPQERNFTEFDVLTTTARDAWTQLQMSTAKLAEQRKETIALLRHSYDTLTAMKERHEKIRKQVKKSMQESNDAYIEQRWQVVPKLRRTYELKCRELEAAKDAYDKAHPAVKDAHDKTHPAAAAPSPFPQPHPSTSGESQSSHSSHSSSHHAQHSSVDEKNLPPLPSSTMPNPASPMVPSAQFEVLSPDGTKEKRIDRFINKVATSFGTVDPVKQNVKNAKTKKEIADADAEYRKAIQQLEILRIKQMMTMERAGQTLDTVLTEKATQTKAALEAYVTTEKKSALATKDIMENMATYVDCIKPDIDVEQWRVEFKKEAFQKPNPVNYVNFYAGESKDDLRRHAVRLFADPSAHGPTYCRTVHCRRAGPRRS
ncbi:hypothetical protein BC936DRAFT_147542 [Jimgerdemannia flammicorona]|uniref:F-BAR domain-containing protein n=1 Tax=Jimgerdemannia flammicorona TaxID=994334 RepID=A0A433D533_9FUNG|nr:hypothetical protein BC936DRAFT_147542 [Jimgerdemannia flammicorona]